MNVFVVSKGDEAESDYPTWRELRRLGHEVIVGDPHWKYAEYPDVVISMGVTLMEQTFKAVSLWPRARLFCYNWDVYEWVWTRPRKEETPGTPGFLDYKKYGDLLRCANEIWVPSQCTGRRTKQWYGLDNWHVILSSCPVWEYPAEEVYDGGYALCCLREIPDPWWGVFERCCHELGIKWRSTKHELTTEAYRKAIAQCRFIVAPLYELSTGGLSLMEAYYHGKPVLISNSQWNGAHDYFNEGSHRACTFNYGDEVDFKRMLSILYNKPIGISIDHKEYITTNFSDERMARDIHARITR